jgi:HlyD family secretion protein
MKKQLCFKPTCNWLIVLSVTTALIPSGIAFYLWQNTQLREHNQSYSSTPTTTVAAVHTVSALGRLEPQGEVITLAPSPSFEGAKLAQLLVKEGDIVQSGQVIGILDRRDRLQITLEKAQKQVEVAQARLAQVEAGAKTGEIEAQKATIARLKAQLHGQKELQAATVARFKAQLQGDITVQDAAVARLKAQLQGDITVQNIAITRLKAQLQGNTTAQKAIVARFEAQLKNAQSEYQRHQQLYKEDVISASLLDTKRLSLETVHEQHREEQANLIKIISSDQEQIVEAEATRSRTLATLQQQIVEAEATRNRTLTTLQQQIVEAEATQSEMLATLQQQIVEAKAILDRITEVRPVDVQVMKVEVDSALTAVKQAQSDLDLAYVRSPFVGQVLKINTRLGEMVSNGGIAQLGQTNQMYAVAEVYETDINKVRIGQRAAVTSLAFADRWQGTVTQIGTQIGKQNILTTDPTADKDARIVEVKIRLDPLYSKKAVGLTNLQVEVVINL